MEFSAVRHYMDKKYCFAVGNGRFVFRLVTKRDDISKAVFHYQDKYIKIRDMDTRVEIDMKKVSKDAYNDYYESEIDMDVICLRYYFELQDFEGNVMYYGNHEFFDKKIEDIGRMFDCPQKLREEEICDVPDWARNKVVYQIFPARFATTHEVDEKLWYKKPITHGDDLKGNLEGITEKMDYLYDLGIDAIYLTPVFKSKSTHKYDTEDYYRIDEAFGDKEDLKRMVQKAHSYGIRVIMDCVFNHTSPEFFAFKDIIEKGEKSKYKNWYYIDSFPVDRGGRYKKPNYKTFAYYGGMPKLNLSNLETQKYFLDVAAYWTKECNIDGWRLDAADEVVHEFWKEFRKTVRNINKDALFIGEKWQLAGDFLEGDEWDSVMNYDFQTGVQDYIGQQNGTASSFLNRIGFLRGNLNNKVYQVLWNHIDSHDTERFYNSCKKDKKKFMTAVALQMLMPGMPVIYYGDELGMLGAHDPDCRRGMLWKEEYQDKEIFMWYKNLIKLRKEMPMLLEGELSECETDDENGLIIISRKCGEKVIDIVIHGSEKKLEMPQYKDCINLINGEKISGIIEGFTSFVAERKKVRKS